MNVEKAIYLNTLQPAEVVQKGRVVSSYAAGRQGGGGRFAVRARGTVRLIAEYRTLGAKATLSLDGKTLAVTARLYTEVALPLEKGEHVFEVLSPVSNDGVTLIAEGYGVTKTGPYYDRVGGCVTPSGCVVYLKRGSGTVEKCVCTGGSITYTPRTETFYDEAYRYDPTVGTYSDTQRFCYATGANFTVNSGVATVFSHTAIRGLAMCDSRTLASGADYLVAFADSASALRFMRVVDGAAVSSAEVTSRIADARRVVSAARGSLFLVEEKDLTWRAYWFHPQGEETMTFGEYSERYEVIPLGKTGGCIPSATVDAEGEPILYYRRENGELMNYTPGEVVRAVSYAEAYQPTATSGLLQVEGELLSAL